MSKNKKIKKLEKALKQKRAINRDWMQAYFDAHNDHVQAFNKQELTIEVVAAILKEMQG